MKVPNNRAEAKRIGATHYFTGLPCKHGHVALRKTKGACVECIKVEWQASAEKRVAYFAAYNKSAAGIANKRRYYTTHKEDVIARALTTPNTIKQQYRQAWKDANPEIVKADNSARRRRHRDASPPWLTKQHQQDIRDLYRMAMDATRVSGEQHVVDHIVPLRSKHVCGLHVPWNLRVTTNVLNARKSNKLPDVVDGVAFPDGAGYKGPT